MPQNHPNKLNGERSTTVPSETFNIYFYSTYLESNSFHNRVYLSAAKEYHTMDTSYKGSFQEGLCKVKVIGITATQ